MDRLENSLPTRIAEGSSGMAAIVFTDVVASTDILSALASAALNDHQTISLMERDKAQMRVICQTFGGCVVKSTGDGLMMCFQSAERAVACAREIQRPLVQQANQIPPEQILLHHIGIHSGDGEHLNHDLLGSTVNITARLQSEALPGGNLSFEGNLRFGKKSGIVADRQGGLTDSGGNRGANACVPDSLSLAGVHQLSGDGTRHPTGSTVS